MRWATALAVLLVFAAFDASTAAVPRTISYQGVLKEADGTVVPDDDYELTFSLYKAKGYTDSAAVWQETQTITVTNGIFNAILGSVVGLDIAFDRTYWLAVSVEGGPELEPRVQLTGSPYALRAATADSFANMGSWTDPDWQISGDNIYRLEGMVGVGTASPTAKLHVEGTVRLSGLTLPTGATAGHVLTSDAGGTGSWQPTGNGDITAVFADEGLIGGGGAGDVHLEVGAGDGIDVSPTQVSVGVADFAGQGLADDGSNNLDVNTGAGLAVVADTVRLEDGYVSGAAYDGRFVNEGQAGAVTAPMVVPDIVSSIDGVSNDGGNIDLVGGDNVTVTPDDGSDTITISSDDADWTVSGDDIYRENGNVGVGTTTPAEKLDVVGTVQATAFVGDGSGLTGVTGSGDTDWVEAGGNVYRETGNVGIGTTNPGEALHVRRTDGNVATWLDSEAGMATLYLDPSAGSNARVEFYEGGGQEFSLFHDAGLNALRVDALGTGGYGLVVATSENVGIGTALPSEKLEVNGTAKAIAFVGDGSGLTGIPPTPDTDWVESGGNIYRATGYVGIGTTNPSKDLHVSRSDAPTEAWVESTFGTAHLYVDSATNWDGELAFYEGGVRRFTLLNDISEDVLRVDAQGAGGVGLAVDTSENVGIGTTVPTAKLDVIGTAKATAFVGDGSGLTGLPPTPDTDWVESGGNVYRATGNVGIGTTNPGKALHVTRSDALTEAWIESTFGTAHLYVDSASGSDGELAFYEAGVRSFTLLNDVSEGVVRFDAPGAGGVGLAMDSSENVGVGTTFPTTKLDVIGTAKATAFVGDGSGLTGLPPTPDTDWVESGGDVYRATGNVGIGTTNPGKDLHVTRSDALTEAWIESTFGTAHLYVDSASGSDGELAFYEGGIRSFTLLNDVSEGVIRFDTPGVGGVALTVDSSENVGVGVLVPTAKLDVAGTAKATAFVGDGSGLTNLPADGDWTVSGSDIYRTTGNVGVGTSSPARKLHISDVMRLEPRADFPTSPSDGDICVQGTGGSYHIYCYLNGSWAQLD